MTLLDLEDYIRTKDQALADYEKKDEWKKKMLVNIAMAGFFSSDRTIAQYNEDIWKLKKTRCKVAEQLAEKIRETFFVYARCSKQ